MILKVLLVNPPYKEVYAKVELDEVVPPLGLAYLASYLRENAIEVDIYDANALGTNIDKLKEKLPKDFDIIGVPSFTPSISKSAKALQIGKEINPDCVTLMGGPHITGLPEGTMDSYPVIDVGVLGEGEVTTLELVRALEAKSDLRKINGIIFREKNELVETPRRDFIEDLDVLPFPAYDLLPMDRYQLPLHHVGFGRNIDIKPFFLMFTSRGCPFRCTYCASKVMWGRKVRYRSAENIIKEIDYLVEHHGIRVLDFADDIFTLNKKRLSTILDMLIERDYNLHFNCLSRVNTISKEEALKLKKAKCYLIRFGVESGSQKILDMMKKDITISQIKNAFRLTREAGISSSASFILGHPGETQETAKETIDLAKEINPAMAHFFIAIPLVGTELYSMARENNFIVNENWEFWKQMPETPVIRTEELAPEDLVDIRKKAYREFYIRPSYILTSISRIRNVGQIKLYLKGLKAVLHLTK